METQSEETIWRLEDRVKTLEKYLRGAAVGVVVFFGTLAYLTALTLPGFGRITEEMLGNADKLAPLGRFMIWFGQIPFLLAIPVLITIAGVFYSLRLPRKRAMVVVGICLFLLVTFFVFAVFSNFRVLQMITLEMTG